MRIVVGMSGGVDSSVAAALLHAQGHDVVGVTLHLWDYGDEAHAGRCCAPEDQYDARRVCDRLGIPHYTFDRRALFREAVVDRFVDDYLDGRTPSPCVRCNESVKLGPLLALARTLDATHIATGHYARIAHDGDGVSLRAAVDAARDQSYFLFGAPLESLRALVLPLGDRTKPDVRAEAARLGLATADKPDSTDLCFVEGADYGAWVAAHGGSDRVRPGTVETRDGAVLGTHDGVHRFTVGQRKGVPGVDGTARYVLRIVPERGAVVVGTDDEARTDRVTVDEVRWLSSAIPERFTTRLRYRHGGVAARVIDRRERRVQLALESPQRGVAPGQAAVFYAGDRVVGGGFVV